MSFGVGAFKGILASAPDISEVDVIPTGYSTKVLAADGSETAKLVAAGSNRQYVTIDQIPENLQHAVVAIEDQGTGGGCPDQRFQSGSKYAYAAAD